MNGPISAACVYGLGRFSPGGCVIIIRYTASWYRRGETCFVYQTAAPCFRQCFGRCFASGQKNLDFVYVCVCVCVFFCSLYVFQSWFVVGMCGPCAPYNDVVLLWVCTARVSCVVATHIAMALQCILRVYVVRQCSHDTPTPQ